MTRDELSMNFGANVELERVRLGYSQAKMAKALDMSLSSYKRILTGETSRIDIYTVHRLYHLTERLGFEYVGDPDPYLDTFQCMRKLSRTQLRMIRSFIEFELAFSESLKNAGKERDYITVLVPTGNMEDGMFYDSCSLEKVNVAPYRKRYGDLIDIGIRVTSNHLQPVYQQDDILLICQRAIRDGDTGIFIDRNTGRAYSRKLRQGSPALLESIGGYGRAISLDAGNLEDTKRWIGFGYVVTKMRTDTSPM